MQIYINKNNQQIGPFELTLVREMLRTGQLSPNDMAFQQGQSGWQPLRNLFSDAGQMYPMQNVQPALLPAKLGNGQRMNKRRLLGIYFASLLIVAIGIFAAVIGFMAGFDNLRGLLLGGFVVGILAYLQFVVVHTIFTFYILYKMWSSIEDGISTSPGKAIGFLFIPVYGVYWLFKAWGGFPSEYNQFVDRHKLNIARLNDGAFVFFPIMNLLTALLILPILALPFVFIQVISNTCDAVNRLNQEIDNKRNGIRQDFTFENEQTPFFTPGMRLAAFGFGGISVLILLLFSGFVIWNLNPPVGSNLPETVSSFTKTKDLKKTGSFFGFRKRFTAMYEPTDKANKKAVVYDVQNVVEDYEKKIYSYGTDKVGNITDASGNKIGEFKFGKGLLEFFNGSQKIMIWDLNVSTPYYALPSDFQKLEGKMTSLSEAEMMDFAKNLPIDSQVKFSEVALSTNPTTSTTSTTTSTTETLKGSKNITINDAADFTLSSEDFYALTKKKDYSNYIGKVIDISGRAYPIGSLRLKANLYDNVEINMAAGQSTGNVKEDERLRLKCVGVEKYSQLTLGNCLVVENKGIISAADTPDFTTTSDDYYKESLNINSKYRTKIIDVTGKVKVIGGKSTYLSTNNNSWITCYPDAENANQFTNIAEGSNAKFRGIGDIGGLKHCIVISK